MEEGGIRWEMGVGVPFTNYYDKFTLKYFAKSGIRFKDIQILIPYFSYAGKSSVLCYWQEKNYYFVNLFFSGD